MSRYALPLAFAVAGGFTGGLFTAGAFSSIGASVGLTLGTAYFGPQTKTPTVQPEDFRLPQTDYGGFVPLFYGTCRTAGTWIDCHPDGGIVSVKGKQKVKQGTGGKKKKVTTYNYFLTAAYGLGEGLLRVDKIWADTKLIFNRDGESDDDKGYSLVAEESDGFVVAELSDGLRLYRGSRRQMPDSVLAGLHGDGACAYRGTAYIVFNNLDLSKFGSRIPTITAQVVRIDSAGAIIDDAAQILTLHAGAAGLPTANLDLSHLVGKTISGAFQTDRGGARNLMEQIARWHYCGLVEIGGIVRDFSRANPTIHTLSWDELGAIEFSGGKATEGKRALLSQTRTAARTIPSHVVLRRSDPNLDFELGTVEDMWQTAPCLDGSGVSNYQLQTIDLQIVADDEEAAPRVGIWKDEMLCARGGGTVVLDIERLSIAPGDVIKVPTDETETNFVYWLIEEQSLSTTGLLTCTGSGWDGEIYTRFRSVVNTGRPESTVDKYTAPLLTLIDTATLDEDTVDTPTWIAAVSAPTGDKWDGADVEIKFGDKRAASVSIPDRAIMGTLDGDYFGASGAGALGAALDMETEIRVVMSYGHLVSTTESALWNDGANRLAIGNRVVRFLDAVEDPDQPGVYTLSGILDADGGTDWTGPVPSGSRVVLLTDDEGDIADGLELVSLKRSYIGRSATVRATSSGDDSKWTQISRTFNANNLRALAPVHLTTSRSLAGDVTFSFTARTRYVDDCDDYFDTGIEPRYSDKSDGDVRFDVVLMNGDGDIALTRRVEGAPARLSTLFTVSQITGAGLDAGALSGSVKAICDIGDGFSREFENL